EDSSSPNEEKSLDDNDRKLSDGHSIKAEILEGCRELLVKENCTDCRNCPCHGDCSSGLKRRCSTSDISSILNANSFPPMKKLSSGKSLEKIDRINLANLVFNPNFKNSAGCVNLPVIRAGQNLAQKNSQRTGLGLPKDVNNNLSPDLTQQTAIDLIAQQLQPQSLDKLNVKLQQLARQKRLRSGSTSDLDGSNDVSELLQSLQARNAMPNQNNALRYKTELCRSYEEGGDCRFGAACTFAHGPEELRPVPRHPLYKTEFCRTYHQHGYCQYGTRCHFIHDIEEADRNAPLRGCKSWGRHDKLSGALLSLASSSGLLDGEAKQTSPSDNDVLLANLRRLYALRMMNNQEKQTQDSNTHFSMSQPMAQQLALAHQQLASASGQHLPLSMTQPLPMEALQMGLQRASQRASHMVPPGRVDALANDYTSWGISPSSPSYPGLSPFGSYQQFSPLPHPQPQAYQHYPFSATAPDLSSALANATPYGMSQQNFASTVNVGHMLPEQHSYQNVPKSSSGSAPQQQAQQSHPA
ncbi:Zinc finger CCCH-type, partial [Trinorchestia longiramus]